ncbi:TetR family transcriptional regulator [Embleya scabrispora]|uniref:TetR/AcrR family transcriptional regulator n=1 Tax=Embleya scabrispora TaxID=159449 RepID=UPI000369B42A|nr:TetR family transcriptional regulator [Embleya scabrispora]MYS82927.1 TetR family transcriptional regulator [Streptomyces sp. SID5474]
MSTPRRSSTETKAVILAAARERFGADGYERATIRAIASDAAIDPAMVMRYFGNKEKLFAAAADVDLRLPALDSVPHSQLGAVLSAHFLDRWEDDEAMMILLRTGVTNEEAAERMRAVFAEQLAPLVGRVCPTPIEAPRRAGLAATQVLGLALCRYVLRLPPIVAMTHAEVVAWLGPQLQRCLTGDLGVPENPSG